MGPPSSPLAATSSTTSRSLSWSAPPSQTASLSTASRLAKLSWTPSATPTWPGSCSHGSPPSPATSRSWAPLPTSLSPRKASTTLKCLSRTTRRLVSQSPSLHCTSASQLSAPSTRSPVSSTTKNHRLDKPKRLRKNNNEQKSTHPVEKRRISFPFFLHATVKVQLANSHTPPKKRRGKGNTTFQKHERW